MATITDKKYFIMPDKKEIIECIIKATCQHFDIDEETLIKNESLDVARIRQLCVYLLFTSAELKEKVIAEYFQKARSTVQYSISLIDAQKKIYRQTLGNLNSIITIANNFDKKYQWHLPSINTTN